MQNVEWMDGWVMDTPQTVITTRAPAVLKSVLVQMFQLFEKQNNSFVRHILRGIQIFNTKSNKDVRCCAQHLDTWHGNRTKYSTLWIEGLHQQM